MFVRLFMHREYTTLTPDTTLRDALRLLDKSPAGALPLMEGGRLRGLVTRRTLESRITQFLMSGIIVDFDDVVMPIVYDTLVSISVDAIIEEAAYLLQEHGLEALPVVESDDSLVGIISEKDILGAFSRMLGLNMPGSRITVRVDDQPGKLAEISASISRFGISIVSIAAYTMASGTRDLVLRIGTDNPQDIVNDLKGRGYKVVHVCQVWH